MYYLLFCLHTRKCQYCRSYFLLYGSFSLKALEAESIFMIWFIKLLFNRCEDKFKKTLYAI